MRVKWEIPKKVKKMVFGDGKKMVSGGGEKGRKKVQTRNAAQEDVDQYAADGIEISLLNPQVIDEVTGLPAVDKDGKELPRTPTKLYYTTTATSLKKDPKINTKGNQGKALYDKLRKDPVGFYQERTGIKPKYETNSKGDKIIIIPAETEENAQGEIIETMPKEAFNMSDKTQRKTFYNYLLKLSKMGEGNSEDSKKIRTQFEDALSKGTAKKLNNDASERARLMKKYFPNKK